MDPRIHWQDILMRIEVPNRTVMSDRQLQNATNNLINRQHHRDYFMLAWRTTGANAVVRHNEVRSMVLRRVAAANPPLPPNSTRGLTPGLINPALGHVPGNVIPQPAMPGDRGRLRVGLGRARGAQGVPLLVPAPAAARPPAPPALAIANVTPLNPPQAYLPLNTQRRNYNVRDNNQRRRSSRGSKDPPPEQQGRESSDSGENNEMDSESDGDDTSVVRIEVQSLFENSADSSQEVPLSHVRAVQRLETAQSTTTKGKGKAIPTKRKASPKKNGAAKTARYAESDISDDAEDGGVEDASRDSIIPESDDGFENAFQASLHASHSAREVPEAFIQAQEGRPARRPTRAESLRGLILQPGDPGFEEAFQESNRARRRRAAEATQAAGSGTHEERHARRSTRGQYVRDSILQPGDAGFEEAFQESNRARRRRAAEATQAAGGEIQDDRRAPNGPPQSAPHDFPQRPLRPSPVHDTSQLGRQAPSDPPSDSEPLGTADLMPPTHAPRHNISAITGRPFAGRHRRPEALSPYGDNPVRRPAVGRTRAAPPPGSRVTQRNAARPTAARTRTAGAPTLLPPPPPPRQGVYFRTPEGTHVYYPDDSGVPAGQQQWPHSNTRTAFTPTQRRELELLAQTNTHPPPPPRPPPLQQQQIQIQNHQNIPTHSHSVCKNPLPLTTSPHRY